MIEAGRISRRDFALRLWGRERVAEDCHPGGWMEGRVRRRHARARAVLRHCLDIAAGKA